MNRIPIWYHPETTTGVPNYACVSMATWMYLYRVYI